MTQSHLREVDATAPSTLRRAQITMQAWKQNIDDTLREGGRLVDQVVAANQEAGLHPARTQEALSEIVAGLSETMSLRGRAIRSHETLGRIVGTLDLQELAWGDFVDSPSVTTDLKRDLVKLRSVANG